MQSMMLKATDITDIVIWRLQEDLVLVLAKNMNFPSSYTFSFFSTWH